MIFPSRRPWPLNFAIGLTWLADEQVEMRVGATRVEIVGMDFRWRGAQTHLADVLAAHPPVAGSTVRLLLVHDPRVFRFVPAGRFDLVLSGHTHGGQIGLDLPGFHWSVLGLLGAYDGGRFERDGTVLMSTVETGTRAGRPGWASPGNWPSSTSASSPLSAPAGFRPRRRARRGGCGGGPSGRQPDPGRRPRRGRSPEHRPRPPCGGPSVATSRESR